MNAGIIVPLVEAAPAVAMGLVNLAKDFVALFKKFPAGTTPEQFMAFGTAALGQAESGYDAFLADVAADQAAHLPTPPAPPAA